MPYMRGDYAVPSKSTVKLVARSRGTTFIMATITGSQVDSPPFRILILGMTKSRKLSIVTSKESGPRRD